MNFLKKLFSRRNNLDDMFSPELHDGLMNEELQAAIEDVAANDTSDNRRKVYELLRDTTFCLVNSSTAETAEDEMSIAATQNEAGELVMVAFTDPAALRRWEPKPQAMLVMPAEKLFEIAIENNFAEILINPAGPAGGKLAKHEFMRLAQGVIPE